MKKLFICLTFLTGCASVLSPSKKPLPVLMYAPAPEGVAIDRYIPTVRLEIFDLVEDPYGTSKNIQYSASFDQAMDEYAKRIMALPEGKRAIEEWHIAGSMWINPYWTLLFHPEDGCKNEKGELQYYTDWNNRVRPYTCPWFDHGIAASYSKWKHIMRALKNRGVELDYFSTENELSFSNWTIPQGGFEAIENDPRWIPFAKQNNLPEKLSTTVAFFWTSQENRDWVGKFNAVMANQVYEAFYEGMWKAIQEEYPNLTSDKLSDYAKFQITPDHPNWDINGWPLHSSIKKSEHLITQGSDLNYLSCNQMCANGTHPVVSPFPASPWNTLLMSLNQARGIYLSAPEKAFWPYIASKSWQGNHIFFEEFIRHIYLGGTSGLVFWNPLDITNAKDFEVLTKTLEDADNMVGFADRKSLVEKLIDWTAETVETCAQANEKTICRITHKTGEAYWTVGGVKQP